MHFRAVERLEVLTREVIYYLDKGLGCDEMGWTNESYMTNGVERGQFLHYQFFFRTSSEEVCWMYEKALKVQNTCFTLVHRCAPIAHPFPSGLLLYCNYKICGQSSPGTIQKSCFDGSMMLESEFRSGSGSQS